MKVDTSEITGLKAFVDTEIIAAITSKYHCLTCDFSIIVEGDVSSEIAVDATIEHLTENHSHIISTAQIVWTDNPYIPPTE